MREGKEISFDGWTLRLDTGELLRDGAITRLQDRSLQILVLLLTRPGELVTREEIISALWPNGVVDYDTGINTAMRKLRIALNDDVESPRYIETVPRKGYRFIGTVEATKTANEARQTVVASASQSSSEKAIRAEPHRLVRRAWVWAFAIIVVVGIALTWHLLNRSDESPPLSIAVIPMADFSNKGERGVFADGLTEELLNLLAQVPELRVTARTSSFAFKDRNEDVRVIGKALGVRYILESSVRSDSERVRVVAQLIDAESGYHLWSKSFDRLLGNELDLQQDIARAVATSLHVQLDRRLMQSSEKVRQATQLYMEGRRQITRSSPEGMHKAIELFEQALATDPNFARAYGGLADAHLGTVYYANVDISKAAPIVESLVEKGLRIDVMAPELYLARGVLRSEQWKLALAMEDFRHAIALNPNISGAYVRLAAAHEYNGEPMAALEVLEKALLIDPLQFILHVRRCLALQNIGRYEEAKLACNRAVALNNDAPNGHWAHGLIALSHGDYPGAIAGYRAALQRAPKRVDLLAQLALLYVDVGMIGDARELYDQAVAVNSDPVAFATRARLQVKIHADDLNGIRAYLDTVSQKDVIESEPLIHLAQMELIAGRPELARDYAHRAITSASFAYAERFNVWSTRWGDSELLTLSEVAAANGDHEQAAAYLRDLLEYLNRLERNGQRWHGLHYLRGCVLAMQGQKAAALRELERSRDLGFRRAWWPKHQPALRSLRNTPEFQRWLQSMEALNRDSAARLR